jgi:hypothetical protein
LLAAALGIFPDNPRAQRAAVADIFCACFLEDGNGKPAPPPASQRKPEPWAKFDCASDQSETQIKQQKAPLHDAQRSVDFLKEGSSSNARGAAKQLSANKVSRVLYSGGWKLRKRELSKPFNDRS